MTLRGSELHPFGRFKPDKEQTCANGGACGFGERKPCVANGRIIIHNAVVVVELVEARTNIYNRTGDKVGFVFFRRLFNAARQ